jgi:hypothetical protein
VTHERLRNEEEPGRRAQDAPPKQEHPLLELQRGAGNRAVSAMLAREPDTKEKEKPKEATGTRATLPGIGTIPLESVQFGGNRRPGSSRQREKGEKQDTSGEISLTSKVGKHSQDLFKASFEGKPMEVEVVIAGSAGAMTLKLKGAIITNFSVNEEFEHWTLHFEEMEHSVEPAERESAD